MTNIAINGFGRIGRLFFRLAIEEPDVTVVAINDLGNVENMAYLLKYDTVYGRYPKTVSANQASSTLTIDGKSVRVLQERDPAKLPWGDLGVDIVVEATGAFASYEKASAHLRSGAKRVVLTAPSDDADGAIGKTVLVGVNEEAFKTCAISSNGSCTTNATSPVAAIMDERIGVVKAALNTIHGYTATQSLVDGPSGKDFRRGRAA
ncbi:MAG: type I glyceraldehyde-3-phosphate dehydrogenase, partial [Candidatus Liptonbacteria bacterium]|nr:type I glyceraldehyde-3-phosphate dehydrogenase [Candidatus Liptonbacteria bacterium]